MKTRSCELRPELDTEFCGKCLKILPGSSDPSCDAQVERYRITYWHCGRSGDRYNGIPAQDRYTEAS